jgi:hypothetical protein
MAIVKQRSTYLVRGDTLLPFMVALHCLDWGKWTGRVLFVGVPYATWVGLPSLGDLRERIPG